MRMLTSEKRKHRFGIIAAFCLVVIVTYACGGGGGSSSGGSGSPEITLSSSSLDFGNVVANKNADRAVTVQNIGTAGLAISQIVNTDPAKPFAIASENCQGVTLPPNGSCTVVVRFAPALAQLQANPFTNTFNILSNDADEPSSPLTVSGKGQGLNVTINKVDSSLWRTIKILVSVTNSDDVPLTNLAKANFALVEAGASLGIFNVANASVTSPLSVVLLMDNSVSLASVQPKVREAAINFLNTLTVNDEAEVIKFSGLIGTPSGFFLCGSGSPGLAALTTAVNAAYTPTLGTKLYDTVELAVQRLAARDPNRRRAVILISDGVDYNESTGGGQFSAIGLDEVADFGSDNKVFVYTIGIGEDLDKIGLSPDGTGAVALQTISDVTGGDFTRSTSPDALNQIYFNLSQILTGQYELTFSTTKDDNTQNSLQVGAFDPVAPPNLTGDDTVAVVY